MSDIICVPPKQREGQKRAGRRRKGVNEVMCSKTAGREGEGREGGLCEDGGRKGAGEGPV